MICRLTSPNCCLVQLVSVQKRRICALLKKSILSYTQDTPFFACLFAAHGQFPDFFTHEFFFNDTKPVLVVHNDTLNYSFEVDINDYANSWYLHINDSNCDYRVELGRRPINQYAKIGDYLYISSSNEMDAPNDHILFDTIDKIVYFRNVKTNVTLAKDISLSFLTKLGKLYNVKDFYKKLYKDENIDFDKLNLKNMPSS